jgi:hypothetical protein
MRADVMKCVCASGALVRKMRSVDFFCVSLIRTAHI